jgi:hypothetical protein
LTVVTRLRDGHGPALAQLLAERGLELITVADGEPIPGSYWGESEAGLVGGSVYARPDTPVHSVLHEACHALCMDEERRRGLDTDAGGDTAEEDAVCYLSILLADRVPGYGRARMLADMDRWGYSFRLGSALRWFAADADEARAWLARAALLADG